MSPLRLLSRIEAVCAFARQPNRKTIPVLHGKKLLVVEKSKFYSSQAHDMDTVEPPRGRIFVVRTLS
jgi:hypothetical protein